MQTIIENFAEGKKPGGYFESRLHEIAAEETWRLNAEIRALKEKVLELEQELARERAQGRL